MNLDIEDITQWPLTTNKIEVTYNKENFFSKYAIVSYYSLDSEYKNLAYEQLAEMPFISVCGIRAKWDDITFPCIRFFIMVNRNDAPNILKSLRSYDNLHSRIDDLEDYKTSQQQRIISSLAINSLGKMKADKMMYNNGTLLLCDDKNFLIPRSRKELVCLKIEVNEYMNLVAKTTSFSNPKSIEELKKKRTCVFQTSEDINGQWWSGIAVKPVIIKNYDSKLNLENLYVQKKRFSDKHNMVPYWPYNPDDYIHGRLFALFQVVESVNTKYSSVMTINFVNHEIKIFDAYRTDKNMLSFLTSYLAGKRIYFENPYKNKESEELISQMKKEFLSIMDGKIDFPKKQSVNDLIIKLCEPQDESFADTNYTQYMNRVAYSGKAMQHKVFYNNEKDDSITKSEARRILIELLVKDCLINRQMPENLCQFITDWTFYRYKIHEGSIIGASLKLKDGNKIEIDDYGFSPNDLLDFETFALEKLHYVNNEKIRGARDYMALKKNGNTYLIIDTDEIPILDVNLIDEAYDDIVNNNAPLSLFKRKKDAHKYLRGYIGFHLWESEGMDKEHPISYSYISGVNSENMQIMRSTKMDRMPRVRKIFILNNRNQDTIDSDINEIVNMLKFGFGRWNELMTYPFPFKFLQEHLDNACEIAFSKHWSEITIQ